MKRYTGGVEGGGDVSWCQLVSVVVRKRGGGRMTVTGGSLRSTMIHSHLESKEPDKRTIAVKLYRRASDFEMAVLAANLINRKFLIDAVPGISPWNGLWGYS